VNLNTIFDILLNQRLGLVEYGISEMYPEIHKNMLNNTLPIFSQYFPCYRRYRFNPADHRTEVETEFFLDIPEIQENGLQIISISTVVPQSSVVEQSAFNDGYQTYALSIEDVIMNSVETSRKSLSRFSFRGFKFIAPNRVKLRGYGTEDLSITLKIAYPSFSSIADSVIEQFLDLATADIKIFVYNKLKHYSQLTLPIGSIDLKLDNIQDGETMRADIIDRFKTKGYPNTAMNRYYTYE
jgi:hypothetical protein